MEILAIDVERGGESLKRALARSDWRASLGRSAYIVQGNRKSARAVRRCLRRMRFRQVPPVRWDKVYGWVFR